MLEVTNSTIGRYKIYKRNNEYYLLDTNVSFFPLELFIAPHLREVRGYKFVENTIKAFYKIMKKSFINWQQEILKKFLYLLYFLRVPI